MKKNTDIQPATPESVWVILRELAESQADTDRRMQETDRQMQETDRRMQDTDRRMQETDRIVKENALQMQDTDRRMQETDRIVKENALQMQETDRRMQETDQIVKETDRLIQETDRIIKETALQMQETDRRMQETDQIVKETARIVKETTLQMKETDRKLDKVRETLGSWDHNHGRFAEDYFFHSFEKGKQNFFGEKFDDIDHNVRGIEKGFKDEYDILMTNGHSVGIVEVKFKAHENDIPKVLKKAGTLRVNFPKFKNHKVYLGLATLSFYPELEAECIEQGIAIIKQVGETVVINDEHLKTF